MRIAALEQEVVRYKVQIEAEPAQAAIEKSTAELLQRIDILEKVIWILFILIALAKQNIERRASCT
jgi:hypothetical protein